MILQPRSLLILVLGPFVALSSCDGQSSTRAIGDPVSGMARSTMIIYQDMQDDYWFGSSEGVYRYDGKNLIHYTTQHGLCNNRIRGIQEDRFGNMYFDTGSGVSKFDGQKFTTLSLIASNVPDNIWKMAPDDLWFAGNWNENGPYRYDGKEMYHLEFPKHVLEDAFNARYPNVSYSPYEVYTIYEDTHGHLWFGSAIFGVCRFDGVSLDWISEEELTELDDGPAPGMRSIIEDKDGIFWFSNILHRYQIIQGSITDRIEYKILPGPDLPEGYDHGDFAYFMSAVNDENGDLWMVTYDAGVWRYDGEELTHYPVTEDGKVVTLFTIYKDNHGVLWLGTHSTGPYRFNGETFEQFVPGTHK